MCMGCCLFTDLLLKYEKSAIAVIPQVEQCLEIVQDPKGLAAIIWILGEYGQVWFTNFILCFVV